MDREIKTAAVVGMGALGLLFGSRIADTLGNESLCFLMDQARKDRYAGEVCRINGEERHFRVCAGEEIVPAGLVIVATKYSGLREAMELMRPAVGEETVILSLLNGISSEEILAEAFPRGQIVDCVAIGMDAMRAGRSVDYRNMGKLQIGARSPEQEAALRRLERFLRRAEVPFESVTDIRNAMWNKFMINVGINQTCMVYDTTYAGATEPGEACDSMLDAMREVMLLSEAEGVGLTEEQLQADLALLRSLNPEGYPSMRQDALASRRSEVELFAGTVLRLAEKHGLDVPVNRRYYETIREMEKDLP